MEKKRFIFDLDGTLLTSDYCLERQMFYDLYGDQAYKFIPNIGIYLAEYERLFPNYDISTLSSYLTDRTNLPITNDIIREWIFINANDSGTIEPGVIETLEYLKSEGKSISVLTNWFRDAQVSRLRKSGILEYIDEVYAGDEFLKPRSQAFLEAQQYFLPEECVMIGDDLNKDYIGARANNIESVLYDKNDIQHKSVVKVKKINEIIDRY